MIAAAIGAIAAAEAMNWREFEPAKCRAHPAIIARLHGVGCGPLIALRRDYKPIGCEEAFTDYADSRFESLRVDDTPEVRALATEVNPHGLKFPDGVRVPILAVLAHDDSRDSYVRRLRALLKVVR